MALGAAGLESKGSLQGVGASVVWEEGVSGKKVRAALFFFFFFTSLLCTSLCHNPLSSSLVCLPL